MSIEESEPKFKIDFDNTKIAFDSKSDKELRKTYRLFKLMNNNSLVEWGSRLSLLAFKLRVPLLGEIVKRTVFHHFCGGESLLDCQPVIDKLNRFDTLTILEYGAESKSGEENLNRVTEEILRAMEFAAANSSVPAVSTKLTGFAENELFEKMQRGDTLDKRWTWKRDQLMGRLERLCSAARDLGVGLYIDAEESWMQDTIDHLTNEMMSRYNKSKAVIHNTVQLYRYDRLEFLQDSYEKARREGYYPGMKLVRGAYMDKEREKAREMGYTSLIQPDKVSTDRDYNEAVRFCVKYHEHMSSCCATHNIESCRLQAELMLEKGIRPNHPHLNFSQLYGMADYITFNLAHAGFNVAKNIPYGPVHEVIPYLIRRAQENTSVTGEMSRELSFLTRERSRRGI